MWLRVQAMLDDVRADAFRDEPLDGFTSADPPADLARRHVRRRRIYNDDTDLRGRDRLRSDAVCGLSDPRRE